MCTVQTDCMCIVQAVKGAPLFSGRSGRPTFFTAVFNTLTPAIKESWVSSLQMAKLTLGKTQGLSGLAMLHEERAVSGTSERSFDYAYT